MKIRLTIWKFQLRSLQKDFCYAIMHYNHAVYKLFQRCKDYSYFLIQSYMLLWNKEAIVWLSF